MIRTLRTYVGLFIMHPRDRQNVVSAMRGVRRIEKWCDVQDVLSKGPSPTTQSIRTTLRATVSRNQIGDEA